MQEQDGSEDGEELVDLDPELKGRNGVEIRLEAVRLKDGQGNI